MLGMLIANIIIVILQLGLPVLLLTWWITDRLYRTGQLNREHQAGDIKSHLNILKKTWKKDSTTAGYLEKRWMRFGGGFYGLTALLTFAWIEVSGAVNFVFNFPGLAVLFGDGVIHFLIEVLVNQIMNFVAAIAWVTYWPEWSDNSSNIFIWLLVPYAGYLAGLKLASRELQAWREKAQDWLSR
jgi:hypothetical protein